MSIAQNLRFGNNINIAGMASFDAGVVRLLAAMEAAGALASQAAGDVIKTAWQEQIDTVLVHGYATGKYHDSITVGEPVVTGLSVEVEVYSDATNKQDLSYPFFLEFGWTDKGGNPHGPYPTLTPAFEASQGSAVASMAAIETATLNSYFPGAAAGADTSAADQSWSQFAMGTAALLQDIASFEYWAGGKAYKRRR